MARFDELDRLGDAIGNTYADCVDPGNRAENLRFRHGCFRPSGENCPPNSEGFGRATRLLVNLARHFKYLKPGEEPGGAFQWQAKKLLELGQLRRENMEIVSRGRPA